MNKVKFNFLLVFFVSTFSYSQSKIQFGLTTEGSWFMPGDYDQYSPTNKNTFGAGIGAYASRNFTEKLTADLGVEYRFKQMKECYNISAPDGGYGGSAVPVYSPETIFGWKNFPLHYVVVPFHLQYPVYKNLFVRGGIEATWLTNYDTGDDRTEWNWTLGFGCQKYKLKWSINYIRGFKDVFFENNLYTIDGWPSATGYRNNMLQLSVSYPIWNKK